MLDSGEKILNNSPFALLRIHVQLKHATITQMCAYLRGASAENGTLHERVTNELKSFKCNFAFPTVPQALCGCSPPEGE